MAAEFVPRQTQSTPTSRHDNANIPRPSPTTTEAPAPERRWAAAGEVDLFPRAKVGTDTCGFISEESGYYPLTCGEDYTCTNSQSARGCCSGTECRSSAAFYTRCLDGAAGVCATGTIGPNTLCCTFQPEYPYCITYLWSTTASPGSVFTQFNCDQLTFSGQYFLAADSPSPSPSPSSPASSQTPPIPSNSGVPAGSGTDNDSSRPNTRTGAIVGGAVGGTAGVALLGLLAWFLLARRRRRRQYKPAYKPPPAADMSTTTPPPPRYNRVSSGGYYAAVPSPVDMGLGMGMGMGMGNPSMTGLGVYTPPTQQQQQHQLGGGGEYGKMAPAWGMDSPLGQGQGQQYGHGNGGGGVYEAPGASPMGPGNWNRAELA
ncbi:hypothetical protein F4809DRAFT_645719 [Biscogniauxia mediterranea]|nr:hypothetical protein F4809DRAFT_645719 [Biscogniauxia mediterranea]